ncbi:MAG TPA: hypothetical protein EYO61_06730, partial [Campylobacterales bacterium]|nr:hypothetical protein [Campylobacterales bacterium]
MFPIANRWKVIDMRAVIKYTPSIALEQERSFLNIKLNNFVLKQYRLLNSKFTNHREIAITIENIPYNKLKKHNQFTIQLYQHYSKSGKEEMGTAPEVWTQINLEDSYIELVIENKPIKPNLSFLIDDVLDIFNPIDEKINYIFPDKSNQTIYNYSFFSVVLGKIEQFRKVDFSITLKTISKNRDNVIVATTKQLQEILNFNKIGLKIEGNINLFPNPYNPSLALIIITAENEEKLRDILYSTFGLDMNLNNEDSKKIEKITSLKPANPYSTPGFIDSGSKVYFKDLGYKSKTFTGFFAPPLKIEFKLYPDLYFQKKATGKVAINYIFPTAIQKDSIANIFVNNKFVSQISILEEKNSQSLKNYLFLDSRTSSKYPASLLQGGKNSIRIDMKMVPLNWSNDALKATILDDSYFEIPEGVHWIAMADLKYFTSSAYPFSIYPDLQDTYILLGDKQISTIEGVMQICKFLGQHIQYPPIYLHIGDSLDEVNRQKNIIFVGGYHQKWQKIYDNAPLVIKKDGYVKDIDLSNKFLSDEVEERRIKIFENSSISGYLLTQFFQSPFNSEKSILMFFGKGIDLQKEIRSILDTKFNKKIQGDLVISKLTGKGKKEIFSFDIKPPYYIGDFDMINRIMFYIGNNPKIFWGISFVLIVLISYLLRKILILHRMRRHENDASADD